MQWAFPQQYVWIFNLRNCCYVLFIINVLQRLRLLIQQQERKLLNLYEESQRLRYAISSQHMSRHGFPPLEMIHKGFATTKINWHHLLCHFSSVFTIHYITWLRHQTSLTLTCRTKCNIFSDIPYILAYKSTSLISQSLFFRNFQPMIHWKSSCLCESDNAGFWQICLFSCNLVLCITIKFRMIIMYA